jgi:alpha-beta hydrolase superfamily lysophospholipase
VWLTLIVLLVALTSALAGILGTFWWLVPRLEKVFLFRPSREVGSTPADVGIPFDQCYIDTPDGCRLSGWHMCPSDPVGGVVYFHGNGGNLGILVEVFETLHREGLQVLAIDYRGYGWSTGVPSEEGLYQDGLAAVRYFEEHFRRADLPLIYWGRSLGSSVAAHAASRIPPNGLILETAFTSKASLVKHYPQFRLLHPFSRCRLDTLRYLRGHSFPVLLLHGDQDRTIPLEEGEKLFRNLTGPKHFYCTPGADHINLHRFDAVSYMRRIVQFVSEVNARQSPADAVGAGLHLKQESDSLG